MSEEIFADDIKGISKIETEITEYMLAEKQKYVNNKQQG